MKLSSVEDEIERTSIPILAYLRERAGQAEAPVRRGAGAAA